MLSELKMETAHEETQTQGYLRPLGSFEELLWQMDKRNSLHATLAARVDGFTVIEEWKEALEQTRRRHPLWSAVITDTDEGRPWFQEMPDPGFALRFVEGNFEESWEQEIGRELSSRLMLEVVRWSVRFYFTPM